MPENFITYNFVKGYQNVLEVHGYSHMKSWESLLGQKYQESL